MNESEPRVRERWGRFVPAGYSAVLTLLVMGPLLGPGYLLLRDAVSTPRSYLTDAALGLGAAAPRAVPQDALLAVLSPLLDGGIIVKAILFLALWAAGYGAAVLVRELLHAPVPAQLVASTVALWNPYLAERLLQGHWSLLTGYAALPWIILTANRIRVPARGGHAPGAPTDSAQTDPVRKPDSAPSGSTSPVRRAIGTPADSAGAHDIPGRRAESARAPSSSGSTPAGSISAADSSVDAPHHATDEQNAAAADRIELVDADASPARTLDSPAQDRSTVSPDRAGSASAPSAVDPVDAHTDPANTPRSPAHGLPAALRSGAGAASAPAAVEPVDAHNDPANTPRSPALDRFAALRDWGGLAGALAAAGLTPTGAVLGAVTALVVVGRRRIAGVAGLVVLASVPWLLATAVSGSGSEPSDPAGIAAFAARAEPGLGTLGSLAGLGGIWNGDAVPATRTTLLAVIGTVLLLTIVATGLRSVWTAQGNRYVLRALLALAALAILLPALGAAPWGMHLLEWLVAHVPGTGLLRDTQKYVALAMPAYALCAACTLLAARFRSARNGQTPDTTAAQRIPFAASPSTPTGSAAASPVAPPRSAPSRALTRTVASVFIVLLVLPLLDLAWGVGGALRPVHYPAGWREVAGRVDGPGDVAVLPGGMFRKFRYSGPVPVLDPAPRMLPRDVLQTGELPVRGRTVAGEGTRARTVESLLLHGGSAAELAGHGVGWVLLERGTPGPLGESKTTLAQLDQVYTDADLTLYRVPGPVDERTGSATNRVLVIAAHVLWAALLLGGLFLAVMARTLASRPAHLSTRASRP